MKKVGVIGASGVIGRALIPRLLSRGMTVRCIVRPGSGRPPPGDVHEVAEADILDEAGLTQALHGLDAVVNLATRIPAPGGLWLQNDRIRIDGTRCLLSAIAKLSHPCRLVQQSIAMLHQSTELADEGGELFAQGVFASALLMEATVQTSALDWVLIRGGAVYGPGTARDLAYFDRIRHGEVSLPADPCRYLSLVHVADLAEAFAMGLKLPARQAYIACDDHPLSYRELFARLVMPGTPAAGAPPLSALPSFRVSNRRLKDQGWRLTHPDLSGFLGSRAVPASALELEAMTA